MNGNCQTIVSRLISEPTLAMLRIEKTGQYAPTFQMLPKLYKAPTHA